MIHLNVLNLNVMMEEGIEKHDGVERTDREEIFTKTFRAGKRTYFFDVRTTRKNDYYLTITESKKRFGRDGHFYFDKHKLFVYREDFGKFLDALSESMDFIKSTKPRLPKQEQIQDEDDVSGNYTNVEFEDLENVEATGSGTNEKN